LVDVRVPADTAAFLTELPGFLATRDATNHPTAVEAVVLHLDPEVGVGEIAADARFARNTAANLRDNGRFALVISRVWEDHRSVQIKGRCLEVREPVFAPERILPVLDGLTPVLRRFGLPPEVADNYRKLQFDPHYLVKIQIDELYDQTPGPGAGRRVS
jgi:hypothetical protein